MEDKEAILVLTSLLKKYPLTKEEEEAVRDAIGILGWTKLVESWKENKKKIRDRSFSDDDLS